MTLGLTDFLLILLTGAACVVALSLAQTLRDLRRLSEKLGKTLESMQSLSGRIQSLSEEIERTSVSVRKFTDEGYAVVGDLSATSGKIREVVNEGAEQIQGLLAPMKYMSLLVAGLKAGFEAYSSLRSKENRESTEPCETDEGGTP
jgi:hypothetical protein